MKEWIASSRSLSSGAHSRDPLAPRNDVKPYLRIPATPNAPGSCVNLPPKEGAGNAGRPMRPIAARAMIAIERTRVSQVTPEIARHSPRNGFTAYFALSPVTGFLATVALKKLASQELDASIGASGPHDFAVRVSAARLASPKRPLHPAPNVRDDAYAPLSGRDGSTHEVICVRRKRKYFCRRDWTRKSQNSPSGKSPRLVRARL